MTFKESEVTANQLLADDKFELGGRMYIVEGVSENPNNKDFPDEPNRTNIGFLPLSNRKGRHSLLIVPMDTKFKIFNQDYISE